MTEYICLERCRAYQLVIPPASSLLHVTYADRNTLWLITETTLHRWSSDESPKVYGFKKYLTNNNMGKLSRLTASQTYVLIGTTTGHLFQCSVDSDGKMDSHRPKLVGSMQYGIDGIRRFRQWIACWSSTEMYFYHTGTCGSIERLHAKTIRLPPLSSFKDVGTRETRVGLICIVPVRSIESITRKSTLMIFTVQLETEEPSNTTTLNYEDWANVNIRSVGLDGSVLLDVADGRVVLVDGMMHTILIDTSQQHESNVSDSCLFTRPWLWLEITRSEDGRELALTQFDVYTTGGCQTIAKVNVAHLAMGELNPEDDLAYKIYGATDVQYLADGTQPRPKTFSIGEWGWAMLLQNGVFVVGEFLDRVPERDLTSNPKIGRNNCTVGLTVKHRCGYTWDYKRFWDSSHCIKCGVELRNFESIYDVYEHGDDVLPKLIGYPLPRPCPTLIHRIDDNAEVEYRFEERKKTHLTRSKFKAIPVRSTPELRNSSQGEMSTNHVPNEQGINETSNEMSNMSIS